MDMNKSASSQSSEGLDRQRRVKPDVKQPTQMNAKEEQVLRSLGALDTKQPLSEEFLTRYRKFWQNAGIKMPNSLFMTAKRGPYLVGDAQKSNGELARSKQSLPQQNQNQASDNDMSESEESESEPSGGPADDHKFRLGLPFCILVHEISFRVPSSRSLSHFGCMNPVWKNLNKSI